MDDTLSAMDLAELEADKTVDAMLDRALDEVSAVAEMHLLPSAVAAKFVRNVKAGEAGVR